MPSIFLVSCDPQACSLVEKVAVALGSQLTCCDDLAQVAPEPGPPPGGLLVVLDRERLTQPAQLEALRQRHPDCEVVLFSDLPATSVLADLRQYDIATYFSCRTQDAEHLGYLLKGAMDKAHLRQEHTLLKESLRHRSLHDDLTGLGNGSLLKHSLERMAQEALSRPDFVYAVMHLDIDRFKNVNDSLGHQEGDQLIVAVAGRLTSGVRPGDTVARLGGDEFTVLLGGIQDASEAMLIADRLLQLIAQPLALAAQEVVITASMGIAISRPGGGPARHLLRDADLAMHRAKAKGGGHIELFDPAMHTRAMELLGLETDLRQAIARDQLLLHFQPIVRLADGAIAGFEALVRWQSPQRGMVSPQQFIPLAEETGLIVPIGAWVLRQACVQLQSWRALIPGDRPLFISVNVSTRQFSQPRLVEQVAQILEQTGARASDVKLEITESLLIDNVESTVIMLHRLQNMNVRLCVDDFGTGYSSLSQLYQLPIHTLKVDRSFVSRLRDSHSHGEIVDTIILLAHNLGMDVIAEGIETREQLLALQKRRCELGQGYYFSRPMPAEQASRLLAAAPVWQMA